MSAESYVPKGTRPPPTLIRVSPARNVAAVLVVAGIPLALMTFVFGVLLAAPYGPAAEFTIVIIGVGIAVPVGWLLVNIGTIYGLVVHEDGVEYWKRSPSWSRFIKGFIRWDQITQEDWEDLKDALQLNQQIIGSGLDAVGLAAGMGELAAG